MMHRLILLAGFIVLLAVPAVAWGGGQPTRTKILDSDLTGSAAAGEVCSFAITQTPVVNNGYVRTFPADANGDVVQRGEGNIVLRYTNDDTGASVDVNASGPSTIVIHADGSQTQTYRGLTVAISPLPGTTLVVLNGQIRVSGTASGEFSVTSFHGTVAIDICAALA